MYICTHTHTHLLFFPTLPAGLAGAHAGASGRHPVFCERQAAVSAQACVRCRQGACIYILHMYICICMNDMRVRGRQGACVYICMNCMRVRCRQGAYVYICMNCMRVRCRQGPCRDVSRACALYWAPVCVYARAGALYTGPVCDVGKVVCAGAHDMRRLRGRGVSWRRLSVTEVSLISVTLNVCMHACTH